MPIVNNFLLDNVIFLLLLVQWPAIWPIWVALFIEETIHCVRGIPSSSVRLRPVEAASAWVLTAGGILLLTRTRNGLLIAQPRSDMEIIFGSKFNVSIVYFVILSFIEVQHAPAFCEWSPVLFSLTGLSCCDDSRNSERLLNHVDSEIYFNSRNRAL